MVASSSLGGSCAPLTIAGLQMALQHISALERAVTSLALVRTIHTVRGIMATQMFWSFVALEADSATMSWTVDHDRKPNRSCWEREDVRVASKWLREPLGKSYGGGAEVWGGSS